MSLKLEQIFVPRSSSSYGDSTVITILTHPSIIINAKNTVYTLYVKNIQTTQATTRKDTRGYDRVRNDDTIKNTHILFNNNQNVKITIEGLEREWLKSFSW